MGYLEHDIFVATSWDCDRLAVLARKCTELNLLFLGPVQADVNGYWTLCVPTCGSKSGWSEKEQHELAFRNLADEARGLGAVDWFWASYGGDSRSVTVRASRDEDPCTCAAIAKHYDQTWEPTPEEPHHPDCPKG